MIKGFYFITDSNLTQKNIYSDTKAAINAGVSVIQYRQKNAETKIMYEEAEKLRSLCSGTSLIINDRIDIALAVHADGVHLGQNDMPYEIARSLLGNSKIIGITVNTIKEAVEAEKKGANYLGVSPVFCTSTKKNAGTPTGLQIIKEIKNISSIPIVAIGGITLLNAPSIIQTGADALCAISATVTTKNVKNSIENFQKLF